MGRDKALIEIEGESLADRMASRLVAVCDPSLEVGPGYSRLPAVRESPPGSGPLAALVAGGSELRRLAPGQPVVVLAVDMPLVSVELLRLLAGQPDGGEAVVPLASGCRQPLCARYPAAAFEVAATLLARGERSMKALLDAIEIRVLGDVGDEVFVDLDTPEDMRRWEGRGTPRPYDF